MFFFFLPLHARAYTRRHFYADGISTFADPGGAGQEPHGRLLEKQLPRDASKAVWADILLTYPEPSVFRRSRLNLETRTGNAGAAYPMDFDPSTKESQLRVWLLQCAGAKRTALALKHARFSSLAARKRARGEETTAATSLRVARNARVATLRRIVLSNLLDLFISGALALNLIGCVRAPVGFFSRYGSRIALAHFAMISCRWTQMAR